jgi:putative transcriptional regulator
MHSEPVTVCNPDAIVSTASCCAMNKLYGTNSRKSRKLFDNHRGACQGTSMRKTELGFGQRLKEAREKRGMSHREVADAIGCTKQAVQLAEQYSYVPKLPVALKAAKLLGVSVDG